MDIDPNVLGAILGLLTSGLTSLLAGAGRKAGELVVGKEWLEQQKLEKTALAPLLAKAVSDIAKHIEWKGKTGEEVVTLFLLSPEVEEVVRQIYATHVVIDGKTRDLHGDIQLVRRAFCSLFTHFLAAYPGCVVLQED